MDFTQQLIGYYKGEWLEAALLSAFGLTMVAVVIAMWFFIDQNMLLKGLFYPIAFLALFTTLAGGFNVYNNSQRLAAMPTQYAENPKVFVQAEVQRFESKNGVNAWWLPLKLLWVALALGGVVATFSTRSDFVHGIAMGLVIIGAIGLVIDGFAHHRAKQYTSALIAQPSN